MTREVRTVVLAGVVVFALTILAVLATNRRMDALEERSAAPCATLYALTVAPAANGAPHDVGTLAVAYAAAQDYTAAGCEKELGPVPVPAGTIMRP